MQLHLTLALYVLATLALTEAKPMYCNDCQYGGGGGGGQYGNRQERYRSEYGYERQSRVNVEQYSGGGYNNGGYGGGGYGGGGQYGGGQYSSGGQGSSGYGVSEYGGGRGFSSSSNNAYVPNNCPHCNVRSYGNGDHNSNTFNLPREAYM